MEQIRARLFFIYNYRNIEIYLEGICKAIERLILMPLKPRKPVWDETDLVLITYGDQFFEKNHSGLYTLRKVYGRHFIELFEIVHLLPFYPSSSDDGFAVIDYKAVDPAIGDWEEVRQFSQSARLMFDLVCNHVSAKSEWFLEYVKGNSVYQNYFIEADPVEDLSEVVRPRTSPLLTKFILANGEEKHLWTTFSEDQVDLNFAHPAVLAEIVDVLLFYLEQGAEYLRLDAIGFIWKEIGTPCLHHEKTHQIIKLFREVIDRAAPGTLLLTETNVPHQDNISYFGNGHDEAHLVYQFPLPALVLYSIHFENTRFLKEWANSLPKTAPETTFYNFLASHDGIGLNPVRGILPEEDIKEMAEQMKREGALISYKTNESGEAIPYEINATYFDALSKRGDGDELRINRFLAAHSILLGLPGIPAIYIQSILGSCNDYKGVEKKGAPRSINRQKFEMDAIEQELKQTGTVRNRIYQGLAKLIKLRKAERLFHPNSHMEVVDCGDSIFSFYRMASGNERILLVHNLSNQSVYVPGTGRFMDIFTEQQVDFKEGIDLDPYQFLWLKPID